MQAGPFLHLSDSDVKIVAALLKLRVMQIWVDLATGAGTPHDFGAVEKAGPWMAGSREADVCDQIRWRNPLLDIQVKTK